MPLLVELGRRHRHFGVRAADFDSVGAALLATLAEFDASDWSQSLEEAWRASYQQLATAMLQGLSEGGQTPRP